MNAGLKGILKPMPEYQSHIRAGVEFTKRGREYIVDEEAPKRVTELLKAISEEFSKELTKAGGDVDLAHRIRQEFEPKIAKLRSGVIEETDKPLVFTRQCFDYMCGAFGIQLVNEPWDGLPRQPDVKVMTDKETMTEVLALLQRQDKRIGDIEAKLGAKSGKA